MGMRQDSDSDLFRVTELICQMSDEKGNGNTEKCHCLTNNGLCLSLKHHVHISKWHKCDFVP